MLATHVAAAPGDLRETLAAIFVRPCVDSVGVSRDAGGPRNPCPSPAPNATRGWSRGDRDDHNPRGHKATRTPAATTRSRRRHGVAIGNTLALYPRWLKKATGRDRSSRWSRRKTAQPATTGPSIPESAPEAWYQRRRYALALVSLSPGSRARCLGGSSAWQGAG